MRVHIDILNRILRDNGYRQEGNSDFWVQSSTGSRVYNMDALETLMKEQVKVFSFDPEEDDNDYGAD